MARTNGKSEAEDYAIDAEHELPAANEGDADDSAPSFQQSAADTEVQKLKAERDNLLDRLARSQAEFDNARKRSAREQQDFREYAVADAVKALLPTLDSF